jgi:hypothetical protein
VIFWAAVIAAILLTSVCWLLILGLCLSARSRDELEARTYPNLKLTLPEAPLPPSWASGMEEE